MVAEEVSVNMQVFTVMGVFLRVLLVSHPRRRAFNCLSDYT